MKLRPRKPKEEKKPKEKIRIIKDPKPKLDLVNPSSSFLPRQELFPQAPKKCLPERATKSAPPVRKPKQKSQAGKLYLLCINNYNTFSSYKRN